MLYHLVSRAELERQATEADYVADSLAEQGFIHLSATVEAVRWVARTLYHGLPDLVVLVVDEDKLTAPLRYEETPDGVFPHLYGPLNRDAIVAVRALDELP